MDTTNEHHPIQPGNSHDHGDHGHSHDNATAGTAAWKHHAGLIAALIILVAMLVYQHVASRPLATGLQLAIYLPAYLLAGWNVLLLAFRKMLHGDFFNEFVLMSVATIGAFAIGSYSEGLAVMVFYSIGEWFQDAAVARAKRSIKALLDVRPDTVRVIRNGQALQVRPVAVQPGETIRVLAGEKVALDGKLISAEARFNTAALTGESKPRRLQQGETVLAGMVNGNSPAEVQVTALFRDSKLSRILELVQEATARKSRTQLFISRFAGIYTPIVFALALCVVAVPYLFSGDYDFREWLYRALVFLVISCPCALVVSIPLGYFGGIGLASRNGLLFKGSNFLDILARTGVVVMDKTGTLTEGIFAVQETVSADGSDLLPLAAALERHSIHPVALAIVQAAADADLSLAVDAVQERPGRGMTGLVNGETVMAGNTQLLLDCGIDYPPGLDQITDTLVVVAKNHRYSGYIRIADRLKSDAAGAVTALHRAGIETYMLSGDKQSVVDKVAGRLGIKNAFGNLLPEDKTAHLETLKRSGKTVVFVGDGINDAPVLALADAGMAMGGLGSDAAIETADVVIQDDRPSQIWRAVRIGRMTRTVVWQNIILAMAVKVAVLVLGAGGQADLWEAVIADVGVALLAILNAVRIQNARLPV
ncbi:heavy metal translocating P-type ATPase [Pedobacter yulinensis]|uniref:P-type Zn(2+) transporter n=1 Tax=Pedobacter yulinensis TaxID=2126353 RepID=A0A2T3HKG9_9SPHI|nr:heavy metal translocating P-type ATPase [Pedobacter yulinensis]PST82924.1 heavy metal translocating P-type ATPase [Pedobacter yulinensis]